MPLRPAASGAGWNSLTHRRPGHGLTSGFLIAPETNEITMEPGSNPTKRPTRTTLLLR